MNCTICGALEESDSHHLLACPIVVKIWSGNCFVNDLWTNPFLCVMCCLVYTRAKLNDEQLGKFVVIFCECYNLCNPFIFRNRDPCLLGLSERDASFVRNFKRNSQSGGGNCRIMDSQAELQSKEDER